MHDRLDVHVVVDAVVGQPVLADLAAADVHVQVLADAVVADVGAGRVIRDGVFGVEIGDVLPHALVDVVAVLPLQALDGRDVLGRDDLRFERVEPRVERAVRLRGSACCKAGGRGEERRTNTQGVSMSHRCPPKTSGSSLPEALRLSYARLVRLHELQREAIRLADREVLVAVALAEREIGRQRPNPFGMVVRVERVAIDVGAACELEARRLGELDDAFFGDIAVARLRILGGRVGPAVIDDAEHATRLQRAKNALNASSAAFGGP